MVTKWKNKIKKPDVQEESGRYIDGSLVESVEDDKTTDVKEKQKTGHISGKVGAFVIGILSIVLLLFCGSQIHSNYKAVEQSKDRYDYYNYFNFTDFQELLYTSSYALYYDALRETMSEEHALAQIFTDGEYEAITGLLESFSYAKNREGSLDYHMIYSPTNTEESRMPEKYRELLVDGITEDELIQLNEYYRFFIQISFDDSGKPLIQYLKGGDIESYENYLLNHDVTDNINYTPYAMSNIRNSSYTFAVPKEMVNHGYIAYYVEYYGSQAYFNAVLPYILIFAVVIILFVLIMPYRLLSQTGILRVIDKIPYEILGTGIVLALVFFMIELCGPLIYLTQSGEMLKFYREILPSMDAQWLVSITNIGTWTVAFGIGFVTIYTIKGIFVNGIWYSLKYRTIVLGCLRWCKKWTLKFLNGFSEIRIGQPLGRKLTMILTINFIVMSVLCVTWFFGIFGAIVWTAFLYWFIAKAIRKFQYDYHKVRDAIGSLADGKIDAVVADDFGYFEDIKHDMQTLQGGFKKAVEEEVRSTKMKSELITNVSHDLKTPLTAIITYVDLLKDPNLDEEKRAQYLETLDRKTDRLKVLIEDLFEMSKASSGNMALNLTDVDVVSLMKQALFEAEDKLAENNILVKNYLPDHKVILQLDSERMYRVLENLIFNISKYAMPLTRAYIEVHDNESDVQIIFKNMSTEEITFSVDEIVERFVRGDQARNTEGSGLGLAISKSFVELQGGVFEIFVDGDLFKVVITFTK